MEDPGTDSPDPISNPVETAGQLRPEVAVGAAVGSTTGLGQPHPDQTREREAQAEPREKPADASGGQGVGDTAVWRHR